MNNKLTIHGRQPILEALRSAHNISEVWIAKGVEGKSIGQIKSLAKKNNLKINYIDKNEIQKMTGPVVHQGVAAQIETTFKKPENEFSDFIAAINNPFILILDQLQDPHNVGAILRTAEIAGVDAVILPAKGSAQLNATVAKTSAGALFHLNIFITQNLEALLSDLNSQEIITLALIPGSEMPMYETDLKNPVAVIVGSEGAGVRKNIANMCTGRISIPQYGKISSLNASVATAVVLYEVIRQRKN